MECITATCCKMWPRASLQDEKYKKFHSLHPPQMAFRDVMISVDNSYWTLQKNVNQETLSQFFQKNPNKPPPPPQKNKTMRSKKIVRMGGWEATRDQGKRYLCYFLYEMYRIRRLWQVVFVGICSQKLHTSFLKQRTKILRWLDSFDCHNVVLQHSPYLQWHLPSHNNTIYLLK